MTERGQSVDALVKRSTPHRLCRLMIHLAVYGILAQTLLIVDFWRGAILACGEDNGK